MLSMEISESKLIYPILVNFKISMSKKFIKKN